MLTAEYYLDQTLDKLKSKCVLLLIFSCISLEEDYFAAPVLIRYIRQVSLLILFSLGEMNLLLGQVGAAQLTRMDFIPVYNLVLLPLSPSYFKRPHIMLHKNVMKAFSLEVQWALGGKGM